MTTADRVSDKAVSILMADDDPDDRMFAEDALKQISFENTVGFVADGMQLLEYLTRSGKYSEAGNVPLPSLILLDIQMPRMNGYEALGHIKGDSRLHHIPVVVMTTSSSQEDISRAYDLGANSFIVKPSSFRDLVEAMSDLNRYWFGRVELPVVADL